MAEAALRKAVEQKQAASVKSRLTTSKPRCACFARVSLAYLLQPCALHHLTQIASKTSFALEGKTLACRLITKTSFPRVIIRWWAEL